MTKTHEYNEWEPKPQTPEQKEMTYNVRANKGTPMTEDEIYQIFLNMMEERKAARKLPFEPSRMDFAVEVSKLSYEKGWNDGYDDCCSNKGTVTSLSLQ